MQQIDSQYQIDPNAWATYEAARVQADATIRAAEIGAKAAWDAAVLQVSIGVPAAIIAAGAALIAGRWAYQAALRAAENQTRLENDKHNAKVAAYSIRQKSIIEFLKRNTEEQIGSAEILIKKYIEDKDLDNEFSSWVGRINREYTTIIYIDDEPEEWKENQWENHALLGVDFVTMLVYAKDKFHTLRNTKEYMIKWSIKSPFLENAYGFQDLYPDKENDGDLMEELDDRVFTVSERFERYRGALVDFDISLKYLLSTMPDRD